MSAGDTAIVHGAAHMTHPIMTLLATGVPLTLLLDLQNPHGPDSQVIYMLEHPHAVPAAAMTAPLASKAAT
jgi:hypothetical protein